MSDGRQTKNKSKSDKWAIGAEVEILSHGGKWAPARIVRKGVGSDRGYWLVAISDTSTWWVESKSIRSPGIYSIEYPRLRAQVQDLFNMVSGRIQALESGAFADSVHSELCQVVEALESILENKVEPR